MEHDGNEAKEDKSDIAHAHRPQKDVLSRVKANMVMKLFGTPSPRSAGRPSDTTSRSSTRDDLETSLAHTPTSAAGGSKRQMSSVRSTTRAAVSRFEEDDGEMQDELSRKMSRLKSPTKDATPRPERATVPAPPPAWLQR